MSSDILKRMNIRKLLLLFKPKYYNYLTRILVTGGMALLAKPIWIDLLNLVLEEFNFSIIGKLDWLLGLILIFTALAYNSLNRFWDLTLTNESQPAFKDVNKREFKLFSDLCNELIPLFRDNEYIFKSTGPNAQLENSGKLRTDLTLWNQLKIEVIVPNNTAIKDLLLQNNTLIPSKYDVLVKRLILHINAFEMHIINPDFDYSDFRFPQEFPHIIQEESFQAALVNKRVVKIRKWISKKLKKRFILDWAIFGSFVYTVDKSRDIDIVVMFENKANSNQKTNYDYLSNMKNDFLIKFKKELHFTVFTLEESTEFLEFIEKNPYKIQKSNG
jgi:predicted nucleotidyltransferase